VKGFAPVLLLLLVATACRGQEATRSDVLAAARELIASKSTVTLVTLGADGLPRARTMEPFQPAEDWTIWMGTNRESQKVAEIQARPEALLHYEMPDQQGYVVVEGRATIVDDPALEATWWMPKWEAFYPDRSAYVLIRFEPTRLEVVSYAHGLIGDAVTWEAPGADMR
jgi:general stress protein 26